MSEMTTTPPAAPPPAAPARQPEVPYAPELKAALDENQALKDELAAAEEALANALAANAKVPRGTRLKTRLAKIGAGVLAAFTTPRAVKAEKSLAAMVIIRVLLWAGAADGTVRLVKIALDALGVK